MDSLFRRLDSANLNVSLGRVEDSHSRYDAITRGVIRSLDDIREFPVDGRGLKLKDIADIVYDKPIVRNGRHLNGNYAVGLDIRKTSQANTVETARLVREKITEIEKDPVLRRYTHPGRLGCGRADHQIDQWSAGSRASSARCLRL